MKFLALIERIFGKFAIFCQKNGYNSTNNVHFSSVQKRIGQDSVYRLPIHPSLDGNTVEMAVEQMQFSENVMRYQTTLSFLNNKISGLRSAIKGE